MNQDYKIIYIVGGGHSGSTLIDMVVGSSKKVFSTGELKFLDKFEAGYQKRTEQSYDGICSCTKKITECEVWTSVRKPNTDNIIRRWSASGSFKILLNIFNPFDKWLGFKIQTGKNDDVFQKIIAKEREKNNEIEFISDSSKDPRRLYELIKDPNVDNSKLNVIHLVKDGRGFVYSYQKQVRIDYGLKRKGTIYLLLEWILVNILSRIMVTKYGLNSVRISYDLFAQNPQEAIQKINNKFKTGISAEHFIKEMAARDYHLADGNRMRFQEIKEIKYDQKWKEGMNGFKRFVLSFVFYPFNLIWVFKK